MRYSTGTLPTSYGYTGQRADAATGLDDYNARSYDPVAGQFTSADTTLAGGLNRYAYVGGNPETRGWCAVVWSATNTEGAGSGCSAYEPQQSWQTIANITGSTPDGNCAKRAVADVSATAGPYHGVDVYDSLSMTPSSIKW